MPDREDRDRAIDRWLPQGLRDEPAADGPACLDAEQLAAWADGGLDPAAVAATEAHVASCARCQAMAAAFVRAEPLPVAAPSRAWVWGWILPAVGLAAVLALWVIVPRRGAEPDVPHVMAENQPAAPMLAPPPTLMPPSAVRVPAAKAPSVPRAKAAATPARPVPAAQGGARSPAVSSSAVESLPGPPAPAAAPAPEPPSQARGGSRSLAIAAPGARDQRSPAQPSAAPADGGNTVSESVNVPSGAPLIQAQSGERSFFAAAPQTAVDTPAQPATGLGGATAPNPKAVVAAFAVPRLMLDAMRPAEAGPAIPLRWRVLADGSVERSATDGASWEPVSLEAGVHVSAGVAPLATTCWLVGRGGTVLRSSDGQHFDRLAFPDTADLVIVRAQDGDAATVTAADGRIWTTADGGTTWARVR